MNKAEAVHEQEIQVHVQKKPKIDRHCKRDGTLMYTASIQWTDDEHNKRFSPIALVCRTCFDWRYLPGVNKLARERGKTIAFRDDDGNERDSLYVDGREVSLSSIYMSKLDFAELMRELGELNARRRTVLLQLKKGAPNIFSSDPILKNAFKKMMQQ